MRLWPQGLAGRRTSITRGNGTTTGYGYDPISRLSYITQDFSGTAQDVTLDFRDGSLVSRYNAAQQLLGRSLSNDGYAFADQLNANRSYTANGLNQYSQAGNSSISHDALGNISAIGDRSFGYSSENLMTSAPGVTLAYDPMMRLYQTSASTSTRFLYDGTDLVAEYDGSGNVLARHVHGAGQDEITTSYEGSGTSNRRWLHADERGSSIALSDGSGAVANINRYDEWGNPQSTNVGRFQYTGQAWLSEIGLAYYKARIYNPRLGRFMQTDPIGYAAGMNLYAYVTNDPINLVDPAGTTQDIVVIGNPGSLPGIGGGGGTSGASIGSGALADDPSIIVEARAARKGSKGPIEGAPGKGQQQPAPGIGHNQLPEEEDIIVEGIRLTISRVGAFVLFITPTAAEGPPPLYSIKINDRHILPHVKDFKHPKDTVYRNAIKQVAPLRGTTATEKSFRGQFNIGKTTYNYHAYTFANGDITIGTIYVP